MSLPHDLYRADQVRTLDRAAIEQFAIPGRTLMERAGAAAFAALCRRWPDARRVAVLCGRGNNGGDGYVVARLAHEAGIDVRLFRLAEESALSGDAHAVAVAAREAGVPITDYAGQPLDRWEVVVDGLLGTGLSGDVRPPFSTLIDAVNSTHAGILALDIPSGLEADTGRVLGTAIEADLTVTFIGLKQGLFTGRGPDCCGAVEFDNLQVPAGVYGTQTPAARRTDVGDLPKALPPRRRSAHKGDFGHLLVVGGDVGMAGAARMAAEAGARTGAGLTSVATRAAHAPLISAQRPELMCHPVESADALPPLLGRCSAVAAGPGLGRDTWGRHLFARLLESRKPMVVDADGLNLLSEEPLQRDNWILTPHPGEAARLLGCSPADIQADRFHAAVSIQASFGGVCILKGAGTLIAGPDGIAVCSAGNPGMASGGMGDVLTGVVGGLLAQGLGPSRAARAGVCLHAGAADAAARDGERGMLALDLMPCLRRLANPGGGNG